MSAPRTCECMTCAKCKAREWSRNRYRLKAYGQWDPHADLETVRQHLINLRADGIGLTAIGVASGVGRSHVTRIANGHTKRIGKETAARLLAVGGDARARKPAYRVTRRLRALNAIGYSTRQLADLLETTQEVISDHLVGERGWVQATTLNAVCELYERLCMTPGGNVASTRIARRRGYTPPLGWDDIDNDEHPAVESCDGIDEVLVQRILGGDADVAAVATKAERIEVVARWTGSLNELERLTGWRASRYRTEAAA